MATVRVTEPTPGYAVYEIEHPLFTAKVARHGAHVMEWQPKGAEPVLYCSPTAVLKEGKAIRGGIPICWPWFNAHPTDPSKPSHGFVRNRFWDYQGSESDEQCVKLRFTLEDSEETRAIWPHAFLLKAEILLGRELEVRLTSYNRNAEPFEVGGALHTYLTVGDVEQIVIKGLEKSGYIDTVGTRRECPPTGQAITILGEIDRIYHHDGATRLVDESLQRTLVISKSGSPSTVVWNPWEEKARAIADMPDEDYRHFTAVEAVIEPNLVVTLEPGDTDVLVTRISVEPFVSA
jgi:D-hexose-6-phosphate mutarotase